MPSLQWSKLDLCNFINICGMKPETREKHGFCNLIVFELLAENINKVTEILF